MANSSQNKVPSLSRSSRTIIVVVAFLGWFFAGMHLGITKLAMGVAAKDLLTITGQAEVLDADRAAARQQIDKERKGNLEEIASAIAKTRFDSASSKWFGYYICALLFGGAAGGLVFGRIGDRFGRVKGMMAAVCCYSGVSFLAYFAQTPEQLWIARFVVCMGVGGMWPNGVALMSEAWESASRPLLAGVIGTAANIGIFIVAWAGRKWPIDQTNWEWVMLAGGAPIVLGLLIPLLVPESPRWLIDQHKREHPDESKDENEPIVEVTIREIFRPPLLTVTLVGILLATVPLFGAWGSFTWAIKWAEDAGSATLKADVVIASSLPAIFGSFLGGWFASILGRRPSYLINCLICLGSAQFLFWFCNPQAMTTFIICTTVLGFFSGVFFGWLPLFLPELFVTRVRSAGAGVCFNFGRIITAITVFATATLIVHFKNDFQLIGRITSLIYLFGAIGILLMPKGVEGKIKD